METPSFIGAILGNWKIVALLGEGAFGAVYEAENTGIAGRHAAVKILHPHMSMQTSIKQRFLNEASAASRAEHENIVQIFDGGITQEGVCYSVMELLRGTTLTKIVKAGRLDAARTINVGVQIAGALQAAHELQIVHRDLKPDNIFIIKRATNHEFVKVLDFGVAKLRGDGQGGSASLTNTGMMVGTPAYMSPEQWMTLADIDGRADIYSLGMILFLCLAGGLPFAGTNHYEWMRLHLEQSPPDLTTLCDAPPTLVGIIESMLAKAREDRPQTMLDVIQELEGVRSTLAIPPRSASGRVPVLVLEGGDHVVGGMTGTALHAKATALHPIAPRPTPPRHHTGDALPQSSTLKDSAGEVEERPQTRPPRGNAGLIVGSLMLVAALVGGIAFFAVKGMRSHADQGNPLSGVASEGSAIGPAPPVETAPAPAVSSTPPTSATPAPAQVFQYMQQAGEALQALDWDTAIARCDQGLAIDAAHIALRQIKARAQSEKANLTTFEHLQSALRDNDKNTALTLYIALPKTSPYREKAQPLVAALARDYIATHLGLAKKLPLTRCDEIRKEIDLVLEVDDGNVEAGKVIRRCDPHSTKSVPAPIGEHHALPRLPDSTQAIPLE